MNPTTWWLLMLSAFCLLQLAGSFCIIKWMQTIQKWNQYHGEMIGLILKRVGDLEGRPRATTTPRI